MLLEICRHSWTLEDLEKMCKLNVLFLTLFFFFIFTLQTFQNEFCVYK